MKRYVIVLYPEKKASIIIESFRINKIGKKLIDNLYPHITLKRSFTLNKNFSENDLIDYFNSLRFQKFKIDFTDTAVMGDALVLIGRSKALMTAHKKLVKDLGNNISTINPQWENEDYKIHLTLLRGLYEDLEKPIISETILDRMTLYEIGSGDYADAVISVNLN